MTVIAALAIGGRAAGEEAFAVDLSGPDGLTLFVEDAVGPLTAVLRGADGAATLRWSVVEREGAWRDAGEIATTLVQGRVAVDLPTRPPGRGLYDVELAVSAVGASAKLTTTVGVVFAPRPDPAAPWGVFATPARWYGPDDDAAWARNAEHLRRLGASWARLNFWPEAFSAIAVDRNAGTAIPEFARWKPFAGELHARGIAIMGGIPGVPVKALSSCPDDDRVTPGWDGGPFWHISKPGDWRTWDDLVERTARDFADEIAVWELYNEPNMPDWYWRGTPEELVACVEHGAAAIRRGNPRARVAGVGVVGRANDGMGFADRLLGLGLGRHLDILTFHYTDRDPASLDVWRALAAKHGFAGALWNSEEESAAPFANHMAGVGVSFKFIHVLFTDMYHGTGGLADRRLAPNADGVLFSVAARLIGAARPDGEQRDGGATLRSFRRGHEIVAVIEGTGGGRLFAGTTTFTATALTGSTPRATDRYGRSHDLEIVAGRLEVPAMPTPMFIDGVASLALAPPTPIGEVIVVEAEDGRRSSAWVLAERPGFSAGRLLDCYADDDGPHWIELDLDVPRAGAWQILLAGNDPVRLTPPRSLSSFRWSIDGDAPTAVDGRLPTLTAIPGTGDALVVLGQRPLTAGRHVLRLELSARRDLPDTFFALWVDAVALRPVE